MVLWEYLYYSYYKFFLRIGKGDDPEFKALIFFNIWTFIHLLVVATILKILGVLPHIHEVIGGVFILTLLGLNYYLLYSNKKYVEIQRKFEEKQLVTKWKKTLVLNYFLWFPLAFFLSYFLIQVVL